MSKWKHGSERQTEKNGSERQAENEQWLWTPKRNNGSECQMKKYDSTGRRNETTALNAKLEKNGSERQNENE